MRELLKSLRRKLVGRPGPKKPAYPEHLASMDLAPFAGTPRVYMIASSPRCGSYFLGHALAEAGGFGQPLEYLNKGNMPNWKARFATEDMPTLMARMIACRTSPNGVFGVKAHWNQFSPYAEGALFAPFGGVGRIVHIYRRDLLGQAISFLRAAQTGEYLSGAPNQGRERYSYEGIVSRARNLRNQNAGWAAFFRDQYPGPVLRIVYEDLIADQPAGFARVAEFLGGGDRAQPRAAERIRRQSDGASREWRSRFLAELREADRWVTEPQAW